MLQAYTTWKISDISNVFRFQMFNFRTLLILGKEKFQTNNQECDFVEMYQK